MILERVGKMVELIDCGPGPSGRELWITLSVNDDPCIVIESRKLDSTYWDHLVRFKLKDIEGTNLKDILSEEEYNMLIQKLFEII